MIERFNFYDVYGYLAPGIVLLALLWAPIGIVTAKVPDDKLASLAVVLLLGYVVGFFLHSMSSNAFSSQTLTSADGKPAYPTVALLDKNDHLLGEDLKKRVQANVMGWFGIDVAAGQDANRAIAARRQDAYKLCRQIVNAGGGYAQQFQGLYSLMRGLAVGFWLGALHTVGWALAAWRSAPLTVFAQTLATVAILAMVALAVNGVRPFFRLSADATANRAGLDRAALGMLALLLFAAGYLEGMRATVYYETAGLLSLAALVYVAAGFRFYALYRTFTIEHARAVWSEFGAQTEVRPAK
jgi:hypothetical protein